MLATATDNDTVFNISQRRRREKDSSTTVAVRNGSLSAVSRFAVSRKVGEIIFNYGFIASVHLSIYKLSSMHP